MEQGTINKDITMKYNSDYKKLVVSKDSDVYPFHPFTEVAKADNDNIVISASAATEKQLTDVSNKVNENKSKIITVDDRVTDLSNRVNADESRINTVDKIVTDLCNEVKTDKETIEELFARMKWVERVFIISFSLIMLNCFYVVFTLMQKG